VFFFILDYSNKEPSSFLMINLSEIVYLFVQLFGNSLPSSGRHKITKKTI